MLSLILLRDISSQFILFKDGSDTRAPLHLHCYYRVPDPIDIYWNYMEAEELQPASSLCRNGSLFCFITMSVSEDFYLDYLMIMKYSNTYF